MASPDVQIILDSRMPLQKISKGSPEFDFASDLASSAESAPADELFFNGQLLPLHPDQRLLLLQTLSYSSCCVECTHDLTSNATPLVGCNGFLQTDMESAYCKEVRVSTSTDKTESELDGSFSAMDAVEDQARVTYHEDEGFHGCITRNCTGENLIGPSTDPCSWSFRSQHSSYWDSTTEKDTIDSSSRDSNGSSQDSCFHGRHSSFDDDLASLARSHRQPARRSFKTPWRLALWGRRSCACVEEAAALQHPSKYRSHTSPCKMMKEDSMSWKVCRGRVDQGGVSSTTTDIKCRPDTSTSGPKLPFRTSIAREQREYRCPRGLKSLHQMKKGLMSQLRMDECRRKVEREVQNGTIRYAPSRHVRARSQSSRPCCSGCIWEVSWKPETEKTASCDPSPIFFPIDRSAIKPAHSRRPFGRPMVSSSADTIKSNTNTGKRLHRVIGDGKSVSTMQELQSALQSAIAHCKESNTKINGN